jgi:aspartate kinase
MSYTVEKIGGTSMMAFDAVLENILLRPSNPYKRVFVVSAYAGITDALLECKKTGKPGIYKLIANNDDSWRDAVTELEQRMALINQNIFADPMQRIKADQFIRSRIVEAHECIENILATCEYGQFSRQDYLPQIREFLASLGEAHSAYNSVLKLQSANVKARFVDLSGWGETHTGSLDNVIDNAMKNIDVDSELPIVTGYCHCDEGLMKTYDRGYSEMTFSRLAVVTNADKAIIHKEYHLSSADPCIVGPGKVRPMGKTNFDVADQLANLGMEAIHPNAAAGLRENSIPLIVKNTFEPEHAGTIISNHISNTPDKVEIIAGKDKVFALHLFDQSMVGSMDMVSCELMELIADKNVQMIGKEMNANSLTYYLTGESRELDSLVATIEPSYPQALVSGNMIALISAIGSSIESNSVLAKGIHALQKAGVNPVAVHSSTRNVNVQFCVADKDFLRGVRVLHSSLIGDSQPLTLHSSQAMSA